MTLPILTSLLFALFIASFFIRSRKELNGFGRDALVPLRGMLVGAYILSRLRKYVTDKKKSIVTD